MSGDAPHIRYNDQEDYKRLFYSNEMACLELPVTLQSGYGLLKVGQAMSKNTSASSDNLNKLIPYDPHATANVDAPARAYLVADHSSGGSTCDVTLDDSYKFIVGDDILLRGDGEAMENLGAITAIDRTTYQTKARITFTTSTGKDYTTGNNAYASVEGCQTCVGVLKASRATGEGSDADGAVGNLIIGTAILYTGMLNNMDSNGRTDISASTFGQFTYF